MNIMDTIRNDISYVEYKDYMNRLKDMKENGNYNKEEFTTLLILAKMTWKSVRIIKERKEKVWQQQNTVMLKRY